MRLGGDIAFIATGEGWLYLATWLDLATREIVGYSMAHDHRASLVVDALALAAGRGRPQPGRIVHSGRGSEYTCEELRCGIRPVGDEAEHGTDRGVLRQCPCRVLPCRAEGRDRHPPLARPGHRPRRDLARRPLPRSAGPLDNAPHPAGGHRGGFVEAWRGDFCRPCRYLHKGQITADTPHLDRCGVCRAPAGVVRQPSTSGRSRLRAGFTTGSEACP
ncbi:DDE-type integrase/transposase/recombinase [Streptomyces sp. NPDC048392]|uniref:DDE-type integrase/transposase/recombinase n=1 Tax=Streptomyces sp. NPDC048392 TaxID=3365543 RepID=UPI0037160F07